MKHSDYIQKIFSLLDKMKVISIKRLMIKHNLGYFIADSDQIMEMV